MAQTGLLDTDLSLPKVINIGYGFGLVESTCLSISTIWSALKFTHPKKGKVYNNSYAKKLDNNLLKGTTAFYISWQPTILIQAEV